MDFECSSTKLGIFTALNLHNVYQVFVHFIYAIMIVVILARRCELFSVF